MAHMNTPHKPTISFAIAMILLGVAAYLGTGRSSITSLIPAFIGVLILIAGFAAAIARGPALVAALVLSLLGLAGPLARIIPSAMRGELALSTAFGIQLIFMAMAAILAIVLILALRRPAEKL